MWAGPAGCAAAGLILGTVFIARPSALLSLSAGSITGDDPTPSTQHHCNLTTTLSVAPRPSITVSRTKPGPSGSKNSARLPREAGTGSPLTSTVSAPAPPVTL